MFEDKNMFYVPLFDNARCKRKSSKIHIPICMPLYKNNNSYILIALGNSCNIIIILNYFESVIQQSLDLVYIFF